MSRATSLLPILALLATTVSATDLTVGPPGSGAAYTTVQAAVTAAQPGDRVLVLPGTYDGAPLLLDKAIEIIGSGSSVTTLRSLATTLPGIIPPPAHITGIAAGQRARVAGMSFGILGGLTLPITHLMLVSDCPGRVELCDIRLLGGGLPGSSAATLTGTLYVRDSAQVVATGVVSFGYLLPVFGIASPGEKGMSGVVAERSGLWMSDCYADGTGSHVVAFGGGGDGGDGLLAVDSTVHLGHSLLHGAQSGGASNGVAGLGGAGIRAIGTDVILHGAANNECVGAAAFEATSGSIVSLGSAASAIVLDAASSLVYASDAVLTGGAAGATLPAAPPIGAAPGAVVVPLSIRLPTVSMTPFVPVGGTLTVVFAGEPNMDHIRAVTLQTAPSVILPGLVLGLLLVDVPTVVGFHVEPLGPSGEGMVVIPVPIDPSFGGLAVVEQAAQIYPQGMTLSPPAATTLGF